MPTTKGLPSEYNRYTPELSVTMETPTAGPPAERVAILVCHGMGQQVRFETLDAIAREVRRVAIECKTVCPEDITVSLHGDGADGFIGRAELPLIRPDGKRVDAHFYEAYWAPLTEGRISLSETLSFFVSAGFRGFRFALLDGVFDRWMFGGRQEFEIPARRVIQLGLAFWMLLLVGAAFTATALLPLTKVLDLTRGKINDPGIAGLAAIAFSIGAFMLILGIAGAIIARVLGSAKDAERPRSVRDAPIGILAPPRWRRGLALVVLIAVVVLSGLATYWIGRRMYDTWLLPAVQDPSSNVISLVVAGLMYLAEIFVFTRLVRGFLIQFAGDVAAYVSPYQVSKFEDIRNGIQERGRRIAKFIYAARRDSSGTAYYDHVYVVGHSLGSVLAYDTLNDAINRDRRHDCWGKGIPAGAYDVVKRTRLLLTFGSPLDKTAFIFRTQKTEAEFDIREALASAGQPLIVDYANRGGRWINIWSRSDWISGSLGYYDAPMPPEDCTVHNIENQGSRIPSTAHTEYWTGSLVRGILHMALTGICPGDVPESLAKALKVAVPL